MDVRRETLKDAYYDVKRTSSYGGVERLCKGVPGVPRRLVQEFLMGEETYSHHKPVRKKFTTNSIVSEAPDHMWQADLADMRNYSTYNGGIKYILFVIDVYSRFLWTIPIKDKKAETIARAIVELFYDTSRVPGFLVTDSGGEFKGRAVQELFKTFNVGYFNLYSMHKAAIVERVQRTIKERLHRYFTRNNTYKYIDILQDLTKSYNRTVHRSIRCTPSEKLEEESFSTHSEDTNTYNPKNSRYWIGDYVKISRDPARIFRKGYEVGWSVEIFTIAKVVERGRVVMYRVKDLGGELIKGSFYEHELQRVLPGPVDEEQFRIEKILRSKGQGPNKVYLVKWLGYPDKFNSYIKASDMVRI